MAGERTQDWSCEQCGMDFADHREGGSLAKVTRASAERWRRTTAELPSNELRQRPDPDTWSVIEYGGHIADVLNWMIAALERMRDEDRPDIAFFDPDRRAEEADHGGRGLAPLTDDINRAVDTLAALIGDLDDAAFEREGSFPWGDRDVLDMARNAAHEAVHHTWDAERVAGEVSSGGDLPQSALDSEH